MSVSTVLNSGGIVFLSVGLFFFATTKASIPMFSIFGVGNPNTRHIYWVYRSPFLIWLIDRMWIGSAILLFQYRRLVSEVIREMDGVHEGGKILQVSCVFGNLTESVASSFRKFAHMFVFDIIDAEVRRSARKIEEVGLKRWGHFFQGNASVMPIPSESFDRVLAFFLFHELPSDEKPRVFAECLRVLRSGGKFVYAEFHRPTNPFLLAFGRAFFSVYEPYAKEMWSWKPDEMSDDRKYLSGKKTLFGGYFQVVTITKLRQPG